MKNSFLLGVVAGVLFPLAAFLLKNNVDYNVGFFQGKPFAFYWIAIALNLIAVRIFYRKEANQQKRANGILLSTFIAMLIFLYTEF